MSQIANLFNVKGKVAVVTGGGTGIGLMITRVLMANEAECVVICSRKKQDLEQAAKELEQEFTKSKCIPLAADLGSTKGCEQLRDEILARNISHVDILVNNSGANWAEPFSKYPEAAFDKLWSINVKACFFTTQALFALLTKRATAQQPSSVINIGSVHGFRTPAPETYAYSATKAAVHHLTRHMSAKLSAKHINVNAIACGLFWTKMTHGVRQVMEQEILKTVLKQRAGDEQDIGRAVLYLACSPWVTGSILALEGGALVKSYF